MAQILTHGSGDPDRVPGEIDDPNRESLTEEEQEVLEDAITDGDYGDDEEEE